MEPQSTFAVHLALPAEKFPLSKDRAIFIRFTLALLISCRSHRPSAPFQLPFRPAMGQGLSKVDSAPEKAIDISEKVPYTPKKFTLNDEISDFTVICEDQRFSVHKQILQKTSPY